MSKKASRTQASSSRVASFGKSAFGEAPTTSGFGSASSQLSYLAEQPDLSSLTDANVVVNFKNLSKKDSKTRTKALEELQNHVKSLGESQQEADESLLSAWIKVYPRASIDGDRRVRLLAHSTHGHVCAISGKKVAKYMPVIVGAWVAGCYDSDRVVARVANEAFAKVFPSVEKLESINKVFQVQILAFCREALFNESPQTLSDERTTKAEDAEAKYSRLVASALTVVRVLLQKLSAIEIEKQDVSYQEILGEKKLWELSGSSESNVRRALYRLIESGFECRPQLVQPHSVQIFKVFISKNVIRRQGGSALDYSSILLALCAKQPACWLDSKDPLWAISRFTELVRRGSQGASSDFWTNVFKLFRTIPDEVRPTKAEDARNVLNALKTGVTHKDEPRSQAEMAWGCFVAVLRELAEKLPEGESKDLLLTTALPLLRQYLDPNVEDSDWTVPAPRPSQVLAGLFRTSAIADVIAEAWLSLTEKLTDAIMTSAPEQSKDFDASQVSVAKRGIRLYELQDTVRMGSVSEALQSCFDESTGRIVLAALDTLRARSGKPYGAAEIIAQALRVSESLPTDQHSTAMEQIDKFLVTDLPNLIFSPSRKSLIYTLYASKNHHCFVQAWKQVLKKILESPDSPKKDGALIDILCAPNVPPDLELPAEDSNLQAFFSRLMDHALRGQAMWSEVASFMESPARILSSANREKIVVDLTQSLSLEDKAPNAMSGLELMTERDPAQFNEIAQGKQGSALLQNLLQLSESPNDALAQRAAGLNERISSAERRNGDRHGVATTSRNVLVSGLHSADPSSVSIDTLIGFARRDLQTSSASGSLDVSSLLPDLKTWYDKLRPMLDEPVAQALAISSQLGSLSFMAEAGPQSSHTPTTYDKDGYSAPIRMALFTVGVLTDNASFQELGREVKSELYRLLSLTAQLANDYLTLAGANSTCQLRGVDNENDILDLVSSVNRLRTSWYSEDAPDLASSLGAETPTDFVSIAHKKLWKDSAGRAPLSIHSARLFARSVSEIIETRGWRPHPGFDLESRFKELRKTSRPVSLVAFLTAFEAPLGSTAGYARACNELVASLTGLDATSRPEEVLQHLILLNSMLQAQDHVIDGIAKQRIIFLIKHMVLWLQSESTLVTIRVESAKLFAVLLPAIQDVYADHWALAIQFVRQTCEASPITPVKLVESARLPLIHAALKLLSVLRSLQSDEESNDDLKDAWEEAREPLASALVSLLKHLSILPDAQNQPLHTVNELLGRQIAASPPQNLDEITDLYQLVTVESQPVQRTAFSLLHKCIPALQEQISVDAALEKSVARLPDELLSLIVEAPTLDSLADASFDREMPPQARGYLSAWLLVFDHFKNASEKVRTDYIAHIKEDGCLNPLLNFISDLLGHSRGKPIDASKFDITIYSFDVQESPTKDLQWLLIHLYYLCLKNVPALSKQWWMECKSRQTVVNIESWTEKHISPAIIADALTTVSDWARTQDTNADDALVIKTNMRSHEITLAKELDAQLLSLAIHLPPAYPLGLATCHGLNRVAVDPAKWKTWILNTQGVIAFSNNSLIDGIIAFRRNVNGALKGQNECAICYSIVGADKQLPTKKCGTCRNLFHGACLYRWFKSSNSSSCPLCRNPFNYT